MRILKLIKILEFYDVPQLFVATDSFNSLIICLMTRYEAVSGFNYFAVQVSEKRLHDFLLGEEDLRNLYIDAESEDAYYNVIVKNQEIKAEHFSKADITEDILPTAGYFYEPDEEAEDYELISVTQQEGVTVLRLGFVDESNSHDIDTECLARAISAYQHIVQSCFNKLYGMRNSPESRLRVTAFKAASFDIEFKSASPLNLFGSSKLSDTLSKIDELMRAPDEDDLKKVLSQVQGRTVSNYKNFMKILNDNKLGIKYKWVSSLADDNSVISTSVPINRVGQIYAFLTKNEELCSEEIYYEGVFLASSVESGKWTLKIEGGGHITGESENASMLSGVTIEKKRYRIKCRETQIQNAATLKQDSKIVLIRINEI